MMKEKTLEKQFEEVVKSKGVDINKLKEAGFTGITEKLDKVERIKQAYANYPVMTQATINAHNKKLREATEIETGRITNYKKAQMISLADYTETPPVECLDAIIEARKTQIFDDFKLLHVVWTAETKKVPDPIVFGTIEGLKNEYFFITQWDNDITLEELLD